jgi:hypothetical protein
MHDIHFAPSSPHAPLATDGSWLRCPVLMLFFAFKTFLLLCQKQRSLFLLATLSSLFSLLLLNLGHMTSVHDVCIGLFIALVCTVAHLILAGTLLIVLSHGVLTGALCLLL